MWNLTDMPDMTGLEGALIELGGRAIYNDEIWAIAREDDDFPIFENIYMDILFSRLQSQLEESFPGLVDDEDFEYWANCLDSGFKIFGEPVWGLADIKDALAKNNGVDSINDYFEVEADWEFVENDKNPSSYILKIRFDVDFKEVADEEEAENYNLRDDIKIALGDDLYAKADIDVFYDNGKFKVAMIIGGKPNDED